jgi:catechol 2,3-dioxygenase-like lactoylglutathione lyase family enzyme
MKPDLRWYLPECGISGIRAVNQSLKHIALIVHDYDEALNFFVGLLGFKLIADDYQPEQDKRWVIIAPPGAGPEGTSLLLARAANSEQAKAVGNQSGGRVFLFLETDDFDRDYNVMTAKGIIFVREPATQAYGKVAVFEDLYGNLWDLVQFS